jgi:hypothetical protein
MQDLIGGTMTLRLETENCKENLSHFGFIKRRPM